MKQETLMCKLFNFSVATYYKRKRNNNSAILLIEKYLQKEDIEEFLENGSIQKMENIKLIEKERYQLCYIFDCADRVEMTLLEYIIRRYKDYDKFDHLYQFMINIGIYNIVNEISSIEYDKEDETSQFLSLLQPPEGVAKFLIKLTEKIRKLTTLQNSILINEYKELLTPPVVLMKDVPYSKRGNV